jgi:hypothetical protein
MIAETDHLRGRMTATGPLSGVTVATTSDAHRFTQDTNLYETFEFQEVPPGKYRVTVREPPSFSAVLPVDIEMKGPGAYRLRRFHATRVSR